MNALRVVMAAFAVLGAADRLLGNRLKLGQEFERGLLLMGELALSMIGMIVMAPWLAQVLQPFFGFLANTLHVDPSIVPASLFANDLGGAALSKAVALDAQVGALNGLVVSSMMGCTVSFTIPCALGMVQKQQHRLLLLGLLCGIVTIPLGCLLGGLWMGMTMGKLLAALLPLTLFSGLIALGLLKCPERCVVLFGWVAKGIKALITIGLAAGIWRYATGMTLLPGMGTVEEGASMCLSVSMALCGAFPLVALLSRALAKPLDRLGRTLGVNAVSMTGLVAALATNLTSLGLMRDMNDRGVLLNAAFAVSGAFTFAAHMAFTLAFDPAWLPAVMAGKLSAGVLAVGLALLCAPKWIRNI